MYPNDPQQQPTPQHAQTPLDYLNQIAPQAPKKSLFRLGLPQVIFLVVGVIALFIILAVVSSSVANSRTEPLERLTVRLGATQKIVTDAQDNLQSSKLRSLNSNLALYLTNTNRDIATPLLAAGISPSKIDKTIVASESTAELTARLEDARLNAVYDRTYAREMAYILGNLLTLMKQTYSGTNSTSLRAFLNTSYENLEPTQQSFANFSASE